MPITNINCLSLRKGNKLNITHERGCMGRVPKAWVPFLLDQMVGVVTDPTGDGSKKAVSGALAKRGFRLSINQGFRKNQSNGLLSKWLIAVVLFRG